MPSSSGSCDYWSVSPSHYLKCGPRTWIIGSADEVAFERYPYDHPFTMAYVQLGSALGSASNSETDFSSSTTSDMGDASPPWQCVYVQYR